MSLRQEITYSGAKVSHIKKTIFRIASPERILQNSFAEIYNHLATPYDKQDGHLFDLKMGTTDRTKANSMSKLPMKWDPGHFGHIRLAKPVFQIPYYTMIVQILNMVCHRCSSLLISPKNEAVMKQIRARKGKARFAYVQQFFKKPDPKNCWNCGACVIKCVKDTKDGSPKIAIKKGGVRNRSATNDISQTILVNADICKKQAAKMAGKVPMGDDIEADSEGLDEITDGTADNAVTSAAGAAGAAAKSERELFDFIDAEVAHTILKKITNEDCELMGLSPESARPDWMIWTVMPVPPPSMRPAVTNEAGQTADDDLTHKLNDIIKTNNQIRNILSSDPGEEERKHLYNWWQLLQYHVATYIDNDIRSNIPPAINRSGRAYKTLRQRINHKEGRIRGNLMGKRADKTARSVITPDPNISIDELGVPYDIAQTLTRDEIVNSYNIKRLTTLVRNGPKWPGATGYDPKSRSEFDESGCVRKGGYRCSLTHMSQEQRDKIVLQPGDLVYRHLLDGDVVLFNRQPSLHKMSMMGHRAKILPGKTFRLNPQVCTPYNADFDGDEMNMHIPNSLQTAAEIREITLVPHQIVSPQASRPIMGLIQDALLASYRFTKIRPEAHLNTMQVMTLLGVTSGYAGKIPTPTTIVAGPVNGIVTPTSTGTSTGTSTSTSTSTAAATAATTATAGTTGTTGTASVANTNNPNNRKMLWDSKAIISTFLPKVNYRLDRSDGKEKELPKDPTVASEVLEIENGVMKSGYFDKATFGSRANSLIHVTWNDWGTEATRNLFDDMNKMAMQWLIMDGFSVGIGDMSMGLADLDEVKHQIKEKVVEAETKIEFLHQGRYPIVSGEEKIAFHKTLVQKLGYWVSIDSIYFSDTGKPTMEQFEADMYIVLNNARKAAEESTSSKVPSTNRMISMINSGSKGTKTNTNQIMVLLGQQDMDGGRIPNGYQRRPLPHFNKDTLVPEAHGFIDNGYLRGLDPTQYFFHAMSGRVGVISTSIKTAETGYLQRRLMKALEDLGVRYDWSVRNANDLVFQFYYGLDGFDGSKLETQKLDYVALSDDDFRMKYQFQPNDLTNISNLFTPNIVSDISETKIGADGEATVSINPSFYEALDKEYAQIKADRTMLRNVFFRDPSKLPDKFYIPVNFTRLIESYRSRFNIRGRKLADIDPRYIVQNVDKLIADIVGEYQIPTTGGVPDPEDLIIIKALIRSYLSSKKLVKLGFTKEVFDYMIQDINRKFQEAYVAPGEMVGAIAAQSIGEPSTQMTLNSVDYKTPMAIVWTSKTRAPPAPVDGPVGAFIDALMLERSKEVQVQPDGVTEYLPLAKGEAISLSCDENGLSCWTALEAVTRHPVVNADGSSTLVRVTLQSGRSVDVTRAKSMLALRNGKIEACDGASLKVGDEVPVVCISCFPTQNTTLDLRTIMSPDELLVRKDKEVEIELTRSFGISVGSYLGRFDELLDSEDGQLMRAICGTGHNKRLPSFALNASNDFVDGLVDGYLLVADSTDSVSNNGVITVSNRSNQVRDGIATLLQMRFNFITTVSESKRGSEHIYNLHIRSFTECMSSCTTLSCNILGDHLLDKVVSLTPVEPTSVNKRVYDLTVAETRNMTTMSGVGLADTFHLAGVGEKANVSRGVPRIREILRVTNVLATPTVTVSIKREALLRPRKDQPTKAIMSLIADKDINKPWENETVLDRQRRDREEEEKKIAHMNAQDLASRIEYTTLRDLISSVTIIYDPQNTDEAKSQGGEEFLDSYYEFMKGLDPATEALDSNKYPWIIRIEFKKNILSQKNLEMMDIKLALAELQDMNSPTGYKGDQSLIFPSMDNNHLFQEGEDPAYIIRLTVKNDIANQSPINLIRYLEKVLLDIRVKGIPGIDTARVRFIKDYPYYDPIDGGIKKTFNYEIDTNGVNMLDIWNMKDIDPERTYSNHIIEIYETLGISAVREAIVNELNEVFLFADASINPRHVELLADMMTSRGYLISVDRHGMSKGDSGPWARASFEETTAQIFKAAMYGEVDPMTGVSANIMTGQFIPAGTNSFKVGLDESMLETQPTYKVTSVTDRATAALAASLGADKVKASRVAAQSGNNLVAKDSTVAGFCERAPADISKNAFVYDF